MASIQNYETTFIVNASLEDPQIDGIIEKTRELIVKNGGEIKELFKWGRKRFAYPLKKKNNGFYVVCAFAAPTDVVAKLERYFTLDENILRSLVIKLDKKALTSRLGAADLAKQTIPESGTAQAAPAAAATPAPAPAPAPAEQPAPAEKPAEAKQENS